MAQTTQQIFPVLEEIYSEQVVTHGLWPSTRIHIWTGVIICLKHDNNILCGQSTFFARNESQHLKVGCWYCKPAFLYNEKYFQKMQHLLKSWR